VTTRPNDLCAELHDRMPAVLAPEVWPAWLGEEPADPRQLKALLVPYSSKAMICWAVSARVGNVKNNDPSLIEPIRGRVGTQRAAETRPRPRAMREPTYCITLSRRFEIRR
jgi:putative SOS response-associated peptidase YedK